MLPADKIQELFDRREPTLDIDPFDLIHEWSGQAQLVSLYAEAAAQLQYEMELAGTKLDVVKAKLDVELRTSPAKFGLDPAARLTESRIDRFIDGNAEVIKARMEYSEKKYLHAVFRGMIQALENRRSALEEIGSNQRKEFFAVPKTDAPPIKSHREIEESAIAATKAIMRRRANG